MTEIRTPSKPEPMGGWIAPDGKFYTCMPFEHVQAEYDLMEQYYGVESWGLNDGLVARGWVHLHDEGTCATKNQTFTQAQRDTLFDIYNMKDTIRTTPEFKPNIAWYLRIGPDPWTVEWEKQQKDEDGFTLLD